jgi:N-formylglutamate amidohydrolase
MSAVYDFTKGKSPLLISIPHDGREIPPDIASRMSDAGRAIPDTDWHVIRLYEFATELGASIISARVSRYVVDLNRPANDEVLYPGQLSTGLCPEASFAGKPLYVDARGPDDQEKRSRIGSYWRPYHDRLDSELERIRSRYGYALLWDAHSIPGTVPLLFDGSLPDLNIGTNGRRSCAGEIESAVSAVAESSPYSNVLNGRFKGGHITSFYGKPDEDVHAMQLELAQRCYMDEKSLRYADTLAGRLEDTIRAMLIAFLDSADDIYKA